MRRGNFSSSDDPGASPEGGVHRTKSGLYEKKHSLHYRINLPRRRNFDIDYGLKISPNGGIFKAPQREQTERVIGKYPNDGLRGLTACGGVPFYP